MAIYWKISRSVRLLHGAIERAGWVLWRERRLNQFHAVFSWWSSVFLLHRVHSHLTVIAAYGWGSFRAAKKGSRFASLSILHYKALRVILLAGTEEQLRRLTLVRLWKPQRIVAKWATVGTYRRVLIVWVICCSFLGILIKDWSRFVNELSWLWFGSWLVELKAFHSFWHEELLSLNLLHVANLFFQDLVHSLVLVLVSIVLSVHSSVLEADGWGLIARVVQSMNLFSFRGLILFRPSQQLFWGLNVPLSQLLFFFFLLFLQNCAKLDSLPI